MATAVKECKHEHWKTNDTCCRQCGTVWSSSRHCHCAGCHQHFYNIQAFDTHQEGGSCRDNFVGQTRGKEDKETIRWDADEEAYRWMNS